MIGYVLHETGLGCDCQYYNSSLPFVFLNKEKAKNALLSVKMTLKLSIMIDESPKYESIQYKDSSEEEKEIFISQMKEDLLSLLTNEEVGFDKPKFVGESSNKEDQDSHLMKINEWKKSPFALRRKYLDSHQNVIDFYNSGGRFDWNQMFDIMRSSHKDDMNFHIEEYEIVE